MKETILSALILMTTLSGNSQQLKQFTLEDLNFGGKNYRAMSPRTLRLWWQGNTLVNSDTLAQPATYPQVFAREHNIYVQSSVGSQPVRVTADGCRQIVYGEAVHRNEFGIETGIFPSPDKTAFAFYRMDQSMVTDYPQVNTFTRIASCEPDAYPMAGMKSHKVTVGVYDIAAGTTVWLDLGDVTDRYFTNITWSPDGKAIYLFELNRDQTDTSLDVYSAETGKKLRTLYTEHSDKYVEPLHPVSFLPWDSDKFLLWSDRDGFRHLYLMDTRGRMLKQVTKGPFVVRDLVGFCPKTKSVIIATNELNPLQSNLFSVRISDCRRTLLDNGIGLHSGKLSADGTMLLDTYSAPDVPRAYDIINTVSRKRTEHFRSPDPWAGYAVPAYRTGTLKAADGVTDLYYRMVLPPDFDASKRYPAVVYVYGGPHAHLVDASWHWASRSWETYMAQKGYVVFVLDSRGSEHRGRDFEQATFRNLGVCEMEDQMCGVDFLKSLSYIDSSRLGVHGWSFGGFMTISLMTTYPDVFKVGVAGGPVIDWKWYEVMYGERYMDTPEQNPDGYARTSLLAKAGNLKGRLQIIIGMNDPTVVPQHALQFLDACIKSGTQPDFFVYPGEGHNMRGHASVHLHERITRYFEDYLK
ncbi:MAG: DPP IV N-terminal domain-containing protein [Bacteroidales bacterium]|nr:DPP IV N-terminal domain-containing protein [Bacteroidales bacterium]